MVLETCRIIEIATSTKSHGCHPAVIWAQASLLHLTWLCEHLYGLQQEWQYRMKKIHPLTKKFSFLAQEFTTDYQMITDWYNQAKIGRSFNLDFTHLPVPLSYQRYLVARWQLAKPCWTRREPPTWYSGEYKNASGKYSSHC